MPGLLFGSPNDDAEIRKGVRSGALRRIAKNVYVPKALTDEEITSLVRPQWAQVVAVVVPDSVVTDRTGIEKRPYIDGEDGSAHVYVSAATYRDTLSLPGLEIHRRDGAGPIDGDTPFLGTTLAQPARQYLDNLVASRARKGPRATLSIEEIERRLDRMLTSDGADGLNSLRDQARIIAPKIDRQAEFQKLDGIIGALLSTRTATVLKTDVARARAKGRAYDERVAKKFSLLADYLKGRAPFVVENRERGEGGHVAGCFIEAYFSNYIEGTRFLVEEAEGIAINGQIPQNRPEDGHDIRGTYLELLESRPGITPASRGSFEGFIDEIKTRHKRVMSGRPELNPGTFKERRNQAGNTTFVDPELVVGTLSTGFDILATLDPGFRRAVFLHYVLSEVHPFNDGNGRLSRIMMTRELMSEGLSRVVIPTVFRDDYLGALQALSRSDRPQGLVRAVEFCQTISQECAGDGLQAAIQAWARAYAFCEDTSKARFTRPDFTAELVSRDGVLAPADYWEEADYSVKLG